MNSSQLAAMVPEHEDMNIGWYNRFAKHPYYGKLGKRLQTCHKHIADGDTNVFWYLGLNSGVMLMNLTRMREFNWISRLAPVLVQYRQYLTWGDQDIINIIFHDNPGKHVVFDEINF